MAETLLPPARTRRSPRRRQPAPVQQTSRITHWPAGAPAIQRRHGIPEANWYGSVEVQRIHDDGTGATTAILCGQGVKASGIDLSPNMLGHAQWLNPGLSFRVGSMFALDVPDAGGGGVCVWYSTIHVPDAHLSAVFREFHWVLIPGGLLLLAFQVGDESRVLREAFGEEVELTFFRRQLADVTRRLQRDGLRRRAELVRAPDSDGFESTTHAFVIARKSTAAAP